MAYTTINKSTDYFNTKLYTGNGGTNAITGVGFQPDWVWIKNRAATEAHSLYDAVRGTQKVIYSNLTNGQATETNGLSSFDSDGFTVGSSGAINGSSQNIASWNWKAGGAGSSNPNGSIASTVSANTTSGFSIVKYTNPSSGSPFTVGHGLGAAPKVIITKNLSATQTWGVWHHSIGFGKYLRLDDTAVEASANLVTATSSTTFSSYYDHHTAGNEIIAYCFAEKKGFSNFGLYEGNGNTDGTFVFCGFRPAFVLLKGKGNTSNWGIHDSGRDPDNSVEKGLNANTTAADDTSTFMDFCSNGFKLRSSSTNRNASGQGYIYMAFAEAPLVGSNNIPATAR